MCYGAKQKTLPEMDVVIVEYMKKDPTVSVKGGREGKHHNIDNALFSDFVVLQVCMKIK